MITYEDLKGATQQVTTYSRYFTCLCPFHNDSSPSLMVFEDGWFNCQGCERKGKWLTLWNKLKGQPVQVMPARRTQWNLPDIRGEDLEELCYQAHMDLVGFPSLGWYLEMRGVDDRVDQNEIGYWDGWYTVPVKDRDGSFITAVFRAAPHIQEATDLRYWCPHSPVMFVPDWRSVTRAKSLFVVYGTLDALALAGLRLPVVTSTAGKKSFDPEWLDSFRIPIYVVPDRGEEKTAQDLCRELGWRGKVARLDYPDGIKDPAGYIEAGRGDELIGALSQTTGGV